MEIAKDILLILHLLGLSVLVGNFLIQMRSQTGFHTKAMLIAAIVQLVSGLGLVGLAEAGPDPVNHAKVAVKLGIALVVLIATIAADRFAARDKGTDPDPQNQRRTKIAFHIAGGMAIVNLLVAVIWQ